MAASHPAGGLSIPMQQALRGLQLLFAVIVIGLVGPAISNNSRFTGCHYEGDNNVVCHHTPGSFYYSVFAAVWTIIVSIYFITATFQPKILFSRASLVLDVLGAIFWFSSFISLAVWAGRADDWWSNGRTFGQGRAALGIAALDGAVLWLSYMVAFVIELCAIRHQQHAQNIATIPMQQPQPPPQLQQVGGQGQQQQQQMHV